MCSLEKSKSKCRESTSDSVYAGDVIQKQWIFRDKPPKTNGKMKRLLIPMLVCAAFVVTGCNPDSFVGSQSDDAAVFVDGGSGHNADGGSGHN